MMREAGGRRPHHGENRLGGIPTSGATRRRAEATAAFPKLGWQTRAAAGSRGDGSFMMRLHEGKKGGGAGNGKSGAGGVVA